MIVNIPDSHFHSFNPVVTIYILRLYNSVEHLIIIEIEVVEHCLVGELL